MITSWTIYTSPEDMTSPARWSEPLRLVARTNFAEMLDVLMIDFLIAVSYNSDEYMLRLWCERWLTGDMHLLLLVYFLPNQQQLLR
jgi:hypothetical protein